MKLLTKLTIEFLPLALFFIASTQYEFYGSTVVLVVATAISLAVMWRLYHQPALMAIINAATGLVAGSITLILHDQSYVQMKPTIISLIYAIILITGVLINKPLFKKLLGKSLHLTEEGWKVLTWLWFFYFLFITGLNEYVRHFYDFHQWAAFKALGLMPLTILYALPQIIILRKYKLDDAGHPVPYRARGAAGRPNRPDPVAARQP